MINKIKDFKRRIPERGQSLVEYALIIMLAGVVVILAMIAFGERVKNLYCEIVLSIDPNIDAPACEGLFVNCNVVSSSPFRMEASVNDTKGENDVKKVVFSVDGAPYNTENHVKYCLQGGDSSCSPYTGPTGKHKFTAVAFDAEGNSGQCSVTRTVN